MDFYHSSISKLHSTGRNTWIIMGISWNGDRVCFCTCNFVLTSHKYAHYSSYGPHTHGIKCITRATDERNKVTKSKTFDKCNSRNYTMEVDNISNAMVQRWAWHRWLHDSVSKVQQSLNRAGQALRVPEGWSSQISWHLAHEGGMKVSPTDRPPLPPKKYSQYSFLMEAESTPGPQCGWKGYVNEKYQWHHQEWNPQDSVHSINKVGKICIT